MFKHENTHSSRRLIRTGVLQGSPLSPLLYSVCTNNIQQPTSSVQLALFADYTAMYMCSKTVHSIYPHLQRAIDELAWWFQTRRIEINPEKSAVIYFKTVKVGARLQSTTVPFPSHPQCTHSVAAHLEILRHHTQIPRSYQAFQEKATFN
ncbi:Probable RNA-directed DNA polymerase from transposon BS [Eumeta japonica]|uniref:Probable RNA-directed DNA polymerase from transposon BS n=1 Tax=Eumeta variegata TaxID=151549 RepID=A0A4C1XGR9_EUMVA|nr:Probable RNA-directed DNA polymerase from transposon BS [Eumeta japonica]